MSDDTKFWVVITLIVVVTFCVLIGAVTALSKAECEARTADIGFEHKWSAVGGCMIEDQPGRWIPLGNWRAIDE